MRSFKTFNALVIHSHDGNKGTGLITTAFSLGEQIWAICVVNAASLVGHLVNRSSAIINHICFTCKDKSKDDNTQTSATRSNLGVL